MPEDTKTMIDNKIEEMEMWMERNEELDEYDQVKFVQALREFGLHINGLASLVESASPEDFLHARKSMTEMKG